MIMGIENNKVQLVGEIASEFTLSHKIFGERFYSVKLLVKRLSGAADVIPLLVSERIFDVTKDYKGETVSVIGQFRSSNKYIDGILHVALSVFVDEIFLMDYCSPHKNRILLNGFICQHPYYKETRNKRELTSMTVAVNRPIKKTDYIPCICWGRNARYASKFDIGTQIKITGRIQSREYRKRIGEEEFEVRTAYEVSIRNMEVVENENQD